MTDEKYGALLGAFARHYWSLPLAFAIDHITKWHPEITPEQTQRVVQRCIDSFYWHNCTIGANGLAEPELVTEHLLAVDADSFDRFLAARLNVPIRECEESVLFRSDRYYLEIPEAKAVYDFGQQELGLDDEWADQLVNDCFLCQPYALCEGESWVMKVLASESFGKIRFRTIAQVECFRDLGNKLYQGTPNPVFRGWKPSELENPPTLRDNIPERAEDIPNHRGEMDTFLAQFGGREKFLQQLIERPSGPVPKKRKIGRNEPCPCGSGKKYKKCCGRNPIAAEATPGNQS